MSTVDSNYVQNEFYDSMEGEFEGVNDCPDSEWICGYEFDKGTKLSNDAIFVLGHLTRNKCVYLQFDDGPFQNDLRDLELLGNHFGYWNTHWDNHQVWFIESDYFEVKV